jgi:predicted O-methyltransferase YrrM
MADSGSRAGATYLNERVLAYINHTHAAHDSALAGAFDAPARFGLPAIQVGASEGKLLAMLLRLVGARRVVEIGTLAGYSAIRLAGALPADGKLWTLELDAKHASVARENLVAAGLASRVTVLEGAALDLLPALSAEGPFDAVFIDADKGNYDHYGRWAAQNTRPGGLLLGDNALFFGRLTDEGDAAAAAMRRFHEEARASFDTVCIPTPDGLLLGVRR